MMKSEVSFFDVTPIGGVLTLLSEDAQQVQDAFGTTKGNQLQGVAQFLTGIILAFVYSWKMALISMATVPAIGIAFLIFNPGITKQSAQQFTYTSNSMTIAEETLSSIRTVRGFNREDKEIERFIKETNVSVKHERILGYLVTGMMSFVMLIIWGMVLGNFYFGAHLVEKGEIEVGEFIFSFWIYYARMFWSTPRNNARRAKGHVGRSTNSQTQLARFKYSF
jgi:ABC-type multidrug transport system fused ATPase/permease subunit